jgi:hypothetical protein
MSIYIQAPNTGPNLSNYPTISQLDTDLLAYESQSQLLTGITTNGLNVNGETSLSGELNMNGTSSFSGAITTTTLAVTSTSSFTGISTHNVIDCGTLNSTTHSNSGALNITGSSGIAFTGNPTRTLDLTATNVSSIYLDTYGNVKAQATAPAGSNWHVTDNTNNNILSIYTDGTQKVKSFNNTLDDGSGNMTILGGLNITTRDAIVQATSTSTAVTSYHQIGSITLAAGSLGASGSVEFQLTNINIKANSLIFLQSANFTQLNITTQSQATSTVNIVLSNISSVTQSWTSGQVLINFLIL